MEKGTGKVYVLKTGKMMNFCSTKCEKHQLKRKPRQMRWTKEFRKEKEGKND